MTFTPSDHIRTILKNLPLKPGVYLMKDEHGTIIYVGKAKNSDTACAATSIRAPKTA